MKRRISILMLAVLLVFCSVVPVAAASANYKAASKAYTKYLKNKSHGKKLVVDIDKNGVPELLVRCQIKGRWYYTLCSYNKKTKKVVVLKKVFMGKDGFNAFMYNVSKKQVYFNQGHTKGADETIVKVKGLKVTTVTTFENNSGKTKMNGKKVSYNRWSSKRKAAVKGFKACPWY